MRGVASSGGGPSRLGRFCASRRGGAVIDAASALRCARPSNLLHQLDVSRFDKAIPTTSVTRTLIDLAGTVTREALEEALDDALRRGLTDLGRLRGVLSRSGSTRRGARVLRQLIAARDGRREKTDSQLEDQLLRLLRSRGLLPPAIHLDVSHGDERICEVDMAYPKERVAIEVHGYRFHSIRSACERDQRREKELVRAGWRVLKATSSQLDRDPDSFIDTLRALLKSGRPKRGNLPAQSPRGSKRRFFR